MLIGQFTKFKVHLYFFCHITVGYQQNRVPHFHRKTTHQKNSTAHGPSQPAQGLPPLKTKAKGPPLLRFVRPLSVSSDPHDVIQAPEPCDVIKALDPFEQLLLRSTPLL
jgi:hypothetical protein